MRCIRGDGFSGPPTASLHLRKSRASDLMLVDPFQKANPRIERELSVQFHFGRQRTTLRLRIANQFVEMLSALQASDCCRFVPGPKIRLDGSDWRYCWNWRYYVWSTHGVHGNSFPANSRGDRSLAGWRVSLLSVMRPDQLAPFRRRECCKRSRFTVPYQDLIRVSSAKYALIPRCVFLLLRLPRVLLGLPDFRGFFQGDHFYPHAYWIKW